MIRPHVTRATLVVALAAGAAGILGTAAVADGGGCGSSGGGWTVVGGVAAGTSSVTVTAPAGTGIVETCVWTGVETEIYAYDPAATSVEIAPLVTPTIVEYGFRLITLEPAPSPEPVPEPAPAPAPEPAPAPAPAPQPATPASAPARPASPAATPAPSAIPTPAASEPAAQEPSVAAPVSVPADDECRGLTSDVTCDRLLALVDAAPAATTAVGPSASVRGPALPELADPSGARSAATLGALLLLAGGAVVVVLRHRPAAIATA